MRADDEISDVIIVLGAKQMPDGSPGPAITRRVKHGVNLLTEGRAPLLLLVGGPTVCDRAESETMADVARELGAPAEKLVLETRSTRTLENAIETRSLMDEHGWRRGLVVTDPFHMTRALYTFRVLGVEVSGSPCPVRMSLYVVAAWFREFVARAAYMAELRAYRGTAKSRTKDP